MDAILRGSLPVGGVARRVPLEGSPSAMAAQVAVGKLMARARALLAAKDILREGGRAGLEEHSGSLRPSGTCKTATAMSPRRGGLSSNGLGAAGLWGGGGERERFFAGARRR